MTDRPMGDRPTTDRPPTDRPLTDRPPTARPHGDRPLTDRPLTDRPPTARPHGDRPLTDRPLTDRPPTARPHGDRPWLKIAGTVFNTRDARALAGFYSRLLGWPERGDEDGWVVVRADDVSHGLSFHEDVEYVPPVWPSQPDAQQMMVHLDIGTDDLESAVAWAIECGATVAAHQPQADVRVMLDPDGHPFCLFPTDRW